MIAMKPEFKDMIIASIYATELRAARQSGDFIDDQKRIKILQYAEAEAADLDIALTFANRGPNG